MLFESDCSLSLNFFGIYIERQAITHFTKKATKEKDHFTRLNQSFSRFCSIHYRLNCFFTYIFVGLFGFRCTTYQKDSHLLGKNNSTTQWKWLCESQKISCWSLFVIHLCFVPSFFFYCHEVFFLLAVCFIRECFSFLCALSDLIRAMKDIYCCGPSYNKFKWAWMHAIEMSKLPLESHLKLMLNITTLI